VLPPDAVDHATEVQRFPAGHVRRKHLFPRTEAHESQTVLWTTLQTESQDVNAAHGDRPHAYDHVEGAGFARPIPSQQTNALEAAARE